jgi:hypothetical protein
MSKHSKSYQHPFISYQQHLHDRRKFFKRVTTRVCIKNYLVEHLRLKRGKVNKTKHAASLPYFVQQRLEWPEHLAHIQWVHVWINRTLWIDKETTACQQHQTNELSTVLMKTSKRKNQMYE